MNPFTEFRKKAIQEIIPLIPIFIEIAFIGYLGNQAFSRYEMEGLVIYAIIIIFAQLSILNMKVARLLK